MLLDSVELPVPLGEFTRVNLCGTYPVGMCGLRNRFSYIGSVSVRILKKKVGFG